MSDSTEISKHKLSNSFLFRCSAVYFLIYIIPFPIGYNNHFTSLTHWYFRTFNAFVFWVGHHVFRLSSFTDSSYTGSGDKVFDYVRLFVIVVLAVIVTIIWFLVDRRIRKNERVLYWIIAYIQLYFALLIINYGLVKVVKVQFPFPYYSLTETYGESSPLRLMINFMGYSKAYNFVIGTVEVMSGLLILFRRTILIGALLGIGILSNVVLVNFCYDVPVKLFALHLLFMAVLIAAPYVKRLTAFFLFNKIIPASAAFSGFKNKKWDRMLLAGKLMLAAGIIYSTIGVVRLKYYSYGDGAFQKTPLFGIYNVKTFVTNGDTLLPLLTDTSQWKSLSIIYEKKATVKLMNDSTKFCLLAIDTTGKKMQIKDNGDADYTADFSYTIPDSSHLLLTGKLKQDSVSILMEKQDLNKYRLVNRGFRWTNETLDRR